MAGKPPTEQETVREEVASRLRELRTERGLSLIEVATATGLSRSFLSLVENGRSDISLGRLIRLLSVYGVGLAELLPQTDLSEDPEEVVLRREDRQRIDIENDDIEMSLLIAERGTKTMIPVYAEYAVGGEAAERISHEGEEFLFVISGAVRIDFGAGGAVDLRAGDSAYFDATRPHKFRNIAATKTRMIVVSTPPILL